MPDPKGLAETVGDFLGLAAATVAFKAFPDLRPEPFTPSANPATGTDPADKLQRALNHATAAAVKAPETSLSIRFTIADVTGAAPFPVAHQDGETVDFIASEAKVAALYTAFELRAMLRRFATTFGSSLTVPAKKTLQQVFFENVRTAVDPKIRAQGPLLRDGEDAKGKKVAIKDEHRSPHYEDMFIVSGAPGAIDIKFTPTYRNNLKQMMVPSSNAAAGACVHGIGYSYLNGALESAGFFMKDDARPENNNGLWLAADYTGAYPKVRGVVSTNDGPSAQAGTTHQLAKLMTFVHAGTLKASIDPDDEMRTIFGETAAGPDIPWASMGGIDRSRFKLNKYGVAVLGRPKDQPQPNVYSEVSLLDGMGTKSKLYVVAWQNLQTAKDHKKWQLYDLNVVADVIKNTITEYET